jgi:hypothetical protein
MGGIFSRGCGRLRNGVSGGAARLKIVHHGRGYDAAVAIFGGGPCDWSADRILHLSPSVNFSLVEIIFWIIRLTGQHVDISAVRNGENVGRHFITPLTTVHLGATVGVHREALVGVDGDAEKAGIGLQVQKIVSIVCVLKGNFIKRVSAQSSR